MLYLVAQHGDVVLASDGRITIRQSLNDRHHLVLEPNGGGSYDLWQGEATLLRAFQDELISKIETAAMGGRSSVFIDLREILRLRPRGER